MKIFFFKFSNFILISCPAIFLRNIIVCQARVANLSPSFHYQSLFTWRPSKTPADRKHSFLLQNFWCCVYPWYRFLLLESYTNRPLTLVSNKHHVQILDQDPSSQRQLGLDSALSQITVEHHHRLQNGAKSVRWSCTASAARGIHQLNQAKCRSLWTRCPSSVCLSVDRRSMKWVAFPCLCQLKWLQVWACWQRRIRPLRFEELFLIARVVSDNDVQRRPPVRG